MMEIEMDHPWGPCGVYEERQAAGTKNKLDTAAQAFVGSRVTEFRYLSVVLLQSSNFPNSESLAVFAGSPQTMRMMKMVVTVLNLTRQTTSQDTAIGVTAYINTSIHVQKQGNDLNYS